MAGRDAALIGPNENQFATLDEDRTGLSLYILPGTTLLEAGDKKMGILEKNAMAIEKNSVMEDQVQPTEANANSIKGPLQFLFDAEVDRIFSTPIGM